jgi:SPP1 gp7 family putative phage head morphogenesis protein
MMTTDASKRVSEQAARRRAKERFAVASRMEAEYLRILKSLTRQIDAIVKGMVQKGKPVTNTFELQQALRNYAKVIEPWARAVATKMVERIARKNEAAWVQMGDSMGKAMRKELNDAPIGDTMRAFLNEQVVLITSLPIDAAERVHKLTQEALISSARAKTIADDILETGKVTQARATLIARTEVARTSSGLTMARAKHVGSTHYIWRTSKDGSVRESHAKMDGHIIQWDTAPMLSDGTQTHAGMIYNCRCYAEPILPDIE